MDFISFVILCAITMAIAYGSVAILGAVLPGHPVVVDRIIWGVAIFIILWTLANAVGILSHSPQIPHF